MARVIVDQVNQSGEACRKAVPLHRLRNRIRLCHVQANGEPIRLVAAIDREFSPAAVGQVDDSPIFQGSPAEAIGASIRGRQHEGVAGANILGWDHNSVIRATPTQGRSPLVDPCRSRVPDQV